MIKINAGNLAKGEIVVRGNRIIDRALDIISNNSYQTKKFKGIIEIEFTPKGDDGSYLININDKITRPPRKGTSTIVNTVVEKTADGKRRKVFVPEYEKGQQDMFDDTQTLVDEASGEVTQIENNVVAMGKNQKPN